VFGGCSFDYLFVDDLEVHNNLVNKVDVVFNAEEDFYREYWLLDDERGTEFLSEAYQDFELSVNDLDKYFEKTNFSSEQQAIVDQYENSYKDFINEYVLIAGEFTSAVLENGYSQEQLEVLVDKVDDHSNNFLDIHNEFTETIDSQSTEAESEEA
jgi:hypothetical protein